MNTDAEGRLVMADALALAREEGTDAIIDIATLTGAMMRALGTEVAGLFGNDAAAGGPGLAAAAEDRRARVAAAAPSGLSGAIVVQTSPT